MGPHIFGIYQHKIPIKTQESFEILVNFERKGVKISITYECEFEIVKYANNMLAFRKDASPKSCSESKKLLKIVKVTEQNLSRPSAG